jgi:hypothetical protein
MKKEILLSIILFSLVFNSFSQKKSDDNILFSIGPSIPVGNFSSHNFQNNNAGFAKAGEQLNFSYEHKINKIFGLAASLHAQRNPVDISAMVSYFSSTKSSQSFFYASSANTTPPPPQNVSFAPFPNWKFTKASWFHSSFLLGFTVELPLSKINDKLTFTTKLMGGIAYAYSPKLNGSSDTDTSHAKIAQSGAYAFGFSYLYHAGLKYKITKKAFLQFGIDYFGTSNIIFKNVQETFNAISISGSGLNASAYSSKSVITSNAYQTIATFNCNIGIGMRL